jgi:dTDP-4-amino-4,6-dideoxygalactose transaminase
LGLPRGSKIGIPLYCCPVVFAAINTAGYHPCFLDVKEESFCLSAEAVAAKRSEIRAVVAVHMFGNPCPVPAIRDAAPGIPIVEDCAQSLGSTLNGRATGTMGEIAFFSFRSGKYVSAGEGGAVFTPDPALQGEVIRIVNSWRSATMNEAFTHATVVYIKSLLRSKPLYGMIGYHIWQAVNLRKGLDVRTEVSLGRIRRSDWAIAQLRLPTLDEAVSKQRRIASFYRRELKLEDGMLLAEPSGASSNGHLFPVRFPSREHREAVRKYLFEHRVDTMTYLDDAVRVARLVYGYGGGCPMAEGLCDRVLTIPCYHSLPHRTVVRITETVNSALRIAREGT